ncbi:MAG TPA: DUF5615 family PIN-like protein [Planctomycetota bacterium]|nr:DUF5615 family PIN-like protein [Planctomycetota bacterium]
MRFLADENVHSDIVAWLRSGGHDVAYAAESEPGAADSVLLRRAREEDRVLVTDDKDFGDLVMRGRHPAAGILLLRLRGRIVAERLRRLSATWSMIESSLPGHLVVVSDLRVRSRPLGASGP